MREQYNWAILPPCVHENLISSCMRKGKEAYVEFNDSQRIITIIVLPQIGLHGRNTDSSHALHLGILTEEPQREIDIVNRAVDKDTAGELGVGNEEPARIELVACL